jgi:hypothetical protein
MTIPIDDESHPEEHHREPAEVKQGNPGKPQADYEHAADEPSDEPVTGADRTPDHRG